MSSNPGSSAAMESAGPALDDGRMTVLKWAWRYGSLGVDEFETLDEAVGAATYADDYGEEALDCFEVWDDAGHRVIGHEEALRLVHERSDADDAARPKTPLNVAVVRLTSPDGKVATYSGYPTTEKAEAAADEFRRLIGADRVKVDPVKKAPQ